MNEQAVKDAARALENNATYGSLFSGDPHALEDLARFVIDAATPSLTREIKQAVVSEIYDKIPPVLRGMVLGEENR